MKNKISRLSLLLITYLTLLHSNANASVSGAVVWLNGQQQADGSWGNENAIKMVYTSEAVKGIYAATQLNDNYYKGIAWLENHAVMNIDHAARRIDALSNNGDNLSNVISYITNSQRTGFGVQAAWGLSGFYTPDVLDTALSLRAMSTVKNLTVTTSAITNLKSLQKTGVTDKGWSIYKGAKSDVVATSQAIIALALFEPIDASVSLVLDNSTTTLAALTTLTSPILHQAITALALKRANRQLTVATQLVNNLKTIQAVDGSWGQDIYATALAIQAIAAVDSLDANNAFQIINIPDSNLRKVINKMLFKNSMDKLTKRDLELLTTLNANNLGISDLTGLEWAINLTFVDFQNNNISNIEALASLPRLTTTLLAGNPVNNSPPIALQDAGQTAGVYPVVVAVLRNDSDPDNDVISLLSIAVPGNGSAQLVGQTIKYIANVGYTGTDIFSYTIVDSVGDTATANIAITVFSGNADEDLDGTDNYSELSIGRNMFINEPAILNSATSIMQ